MNTDTSDRPKNDEAARRRRMDLLVRRLPQWLGGIVHRLLEPSAWWLRVPAGLLLIVGGFLAILPIFGLWMLPLGLVLLSEDIPPLRRVSGRILAWIEHRHPSWMGLQSPSPDNLYNVRKGNQ